MAGVGAALGERAELGGREVRELVHARAPASALAAVHGVDLGQVRVEGGGLARAGGVAVVCGGRAGGEEGKGRPAWSVGCPGFSQGRG